MDNLKALPSYDANNWLLREAAKAAEGIEERHAKRMEREANRPILEDGECMHCGVACVGLSCWRCCEEGQ